MREVINALRHLVRAGCGWRMLPIHFGPRQTIYGWFRRLARKLLFATLHDVMRMLDRQAQAPQDAPERRRPRQPERQGPAELRASRL